MEIAQRSVREIAASAEGDEGQDLVVPAAHCGSLQSGQLPEQALHALRVVHAELGHPSPKLGEVPDLQVTSLSAGPGHGSGVRVPIAVGN
jgi:hypothetical protein